MNIKLQQLRHFLFVVEEGGFRSAASKANRSQATLSSSIKALESELGQRLFEKGNNATLTQYGERCLPKISQFMATYERLEAELKASALGQNGRLSIASVPSLASKLIPNVLAEYAKCYPNVEISLIDDNSVGVSNRLLTGEVDIGFGNLTSLDLDSFDFYPLASDPVGIVCSKHHRLATFHQGAVWQELQSEAFIYNGTCSLLESTPASVLNKKPKFEVGNLTSLFSLLRNQLGVTTLPKLAFFDQDDELVWLPLISPRVERKVGIFSLKSKTPSPQARIFAELSLSHVTSLN